MKRYLIESEEANCYIAYTCMAGSEEEAKEILKHIKELERQYDELKIRLKKQKELTEVNREERKFFLMSNISVIVIPIYVSLLSKYPLGRTPIEIFKTFMIFNTYIKSLFVMVSWLAGFIKPFENNTIIGRIINKIKRPKRKQIIKEIKHKLEKCQENRKNYIATHNFQVISENDNRLPYSEWNEIQKRVNDLRQQIELENNKNLTNARNPYSDSVSISPIEHDYDTPEEFCGDLTGLEKTQECKRHLLTRNNNQ